jgi:hypothetical protein
MANNVGQITVKMRAEIAEFTSDLGKANQEAARTAASINREISRNSREAKESLELLGEAFEVHLPRSIRKTLAEIDGFREVAAAAFGASFVLGFGAVLAENVIPKLREGWNVLMEWAGAEHNATKEELEYQKHLDENIKKVKELNFETSLIGKSAEEQAKMRADHARDAEGDDRKRIKAAQDIIDAHAKANAAIAPPDFSAVDYVNGGFIIPEVIPKEVIEATKNLETARSDLSVKTAETTKAEREYTQAQKEAGDQAAQTAKQRQQEVAAAFATLASIGSRVAKNNNDVLGEINARNDAEFAKVRAFGLKYREVLAVTLDEELQIRLAKRKEIADAEVKLLMDANKAVADTVKAGEAGIIAALNLSGPKSTVTFSHNPFQEQIDALNGPGAQAAIDRGKIMDDMWTQLRTHSEQYAFEVQKVDAAYAGSKISTEYVHALEVIKQHYDENTIALNQFANQAGQSMQSLIAGTETWQNALKGVLGELILLIPKLLFAKEIQSMMAPGAGGGTNFIGGLLGGLLGVGHADGGAVSAGTIYPVGEKGPELFMPGTSGTIIPNHNLGGGASVIVNNDFRGVDAATIPYVEQRVAQGVRVAVQQALAKGADQQRRR